MNQYYFETLDTSHSSQLPETFKLANIDVLYDASTGIYAARLQLSALNQHVAITVAVEQVHEMLKLIAVSGDAFRIMLNGLTVNRLADELPNVASFETRPDGNGYYQVSTHDIAEAREQIGLLKIRGSMQFETDALAWRDTWPNWLPIALELNYLATISSIPEAALILHYSALEYLEEALIGKADAILPSMLSEGQTGRFRAAMHDLLAGFHLPADMTKRLVEHIWGTRRESQVDRIAVALEKVGIKTTKKEVREVIQQRGRIAHGNKPSNKNEFRRATNNVQHWVQEALRTILNRRLEPVPIEEAPNEEPRRVILDIRKDVYANYEHIAELLGMDTLDLMQEALEAGCIPRPAQRWRQWCLSIFCRTRS